MTDPFKPTIILTEKDIYFNEIDASGCVCKYKIESGVPVKVKDLGKIKDFFNAALAKAAIMTESDVQRMDVGGMTHIELAAVRVAVSAAGGDLKATQELCDRILGKAKMVSESTNLNLTIDDILNGVEVKGNVVDVNRNETED